MTIIACPAPRRADNHCEATMKPTPAASNMARRLRHFVWSKQNRAPIHSTYGVKRIHANAHGEFRRASAAVSRKRTVQDLISSGPTRMMVFSDLAVSLITHQ